MDEQQIDEMFISHGFVRDTFLAGGIDKYEPKKGEQGEQIYRLGFYVHGKKHGGHYYLATVQGRFDPEKQVYELKLEKEKYDDHDNIESLEKRLTGILEEKGFINTALDELKKGLKLPETVNVACSESDIEIEMGYVFSITGQDFEQVYTDFEKALKILGYIQGRLPNKDETKHGGPC